MKKKLSFLLLLTILCAGLLTGCGHSHTWHTATCTEPMVCKDCGEQKGKPLGHLWQEASCLSAETCIACGESRGQKTEHNFVPATCTEPETCTGCGETKGEALGHTLQAASYQSAALCSVCGSAVGAPLLPDFDKYNMADFMRRDILYTYTTQTEDGQSLTEGRTSFQNYQVIVTGQEPIVGELIIPRETFFEREGYEWHIVTLNTVFSDEAYRQGKARLEPFVTDYYSLELWQNTLDKSAGAQWSYTANISGEEVHIFVEHAAKIVTNANGSETVTLQFAVHMPKGYDGVVVGLKNSAVDLSAKPLGEAYTKKDFIFFRLDGK